MNINIKVVKTLVIDVTQAEFTLIHMALVTQLKHTEPNSEQYRILYSMLKSIEAMPSL